MAGHVRGAACANARRHPRRRLSARHAGELLKSDLSPNKLQHPTPLRRNSSLPHRFATSSLPRIHPFPTSFPSLNPQRLYWRRQWAWAVLFASPVLTYYGIGFLNRYAANPHGAVPGPTSILPPCSNRCSFPAGTLMSLVDEGLMSLLLTLRVFFLSASSHRSTSMQLQSLVHTPAVQMAVRER